MLLQTNSYIVPKEKRAEHARLLHRFRKTLFKLGCDQFECYEQTGANWSSGEPTNRFVQIMRFRDRRHQQQVQEAERNDPTAQGLIKEFCELINFPYQQQQGYFAVGFYTSILPVTSARATPGTELPETADEIAGEAPEKGADSSAPEMIPIPGEPSAQAGDNPIQPDSGGEADVAVADFGEILDDRDLDIETDDTSPARSSNEEQPRS